MKRALIVVLVLLALPLAAIAAASWFLNGDALKAHLVEQVRRTTGRELTIAGPVSLAWSLSPTIAMTDVSLGNPPGFTRPQMAHVDRIEAAIDVVSLFQRRIAIDRVSIASPSVRLEQNAAGRANWDFRPPETAAATSATPSAPRERFTVILGAVEITDAAIAWGQQTATMPRVGYDPASGRVDGSIIAANTSFALAGHAGPIAGTAFPVDLRLAGSGIAATLVGTSAAATLTLTAADLAAVSPLVGRALLPMHDVVLSTTLPGPLRLQAGTATIGPLTLQHALLTAASPSDAGEFSAAATIGSLPLALSGHVASLAALLRGPAPVDARIEAPGLVATAVGTLAATGAGDVQLTLQSPDLAAVGAPAGVRLPAFRSLDATAGLQLGPGQVTLNGFRLTSTEGDLAGTFTFSNAGRPSLRGTLTSTALDLDALTPSPVAPPAPAAPSEPSPAPAPRPTRLIPDTKLPLAPLRDGDADLQFAIGSLRAGGAVYQSVLAHAVLQNGTLRLDPLSTGMGSATARATLQVDAAATPPGLHLTIDAPDLPFGAVLALAGKPSQSPGSIDIRADLTGVGDTIRAIAATLTGHAGLAVVDGEIDNEVFEHLAAAALHGADLPIESAGTTTLRCTAIRADATAGLVQLGALALDTSKLALDGTGTVNLADESIDLHLRPKLRLGGGLSVPVRVRGTLASPKVALDPGAIASGRVGIVIGGGAPPDTCGPALAQARSAARDDQVGAAVALPPPTRAIKPADLLRGLLR